MSKVSVVILNWNGKDMTIACLESLKRQIFRDFTVVVVDNGSVDGSVEHLEEHYGTDPNITILPQPKNLGFDGGVNVGIKASNSEYIALLNNDTIPDPDWLEKLVAVLDRNPKIGIIQPKLLKPERDVKGYKIDSTGDFYHVWGLPSPRGRDTYDTGQYDTPGEVFGACAAATLYRSRMLKQIGIFDEAFFAYYEDVDMSFRARLAGYIVWYEPGTVVYHEVGATSGGGNNPFTRYLGPKNAWYVYVKNMPGWLFWKYLPKFLFFQGLSWANAFRIHLGWAHTRSMGMGLIMTPWMLVQRWRIQRRRKLTTAQVDALLLKTVPSGVGPMFRRYFGWLMKNEAA
jgi:GT2 family glycosyltransferase